MKPQEALRDIHLPPAPTWQSGDSGWWLAGPLLLFLVLALLVYWRRRPRARAQRARRELQRLRQQHEQHGDAMATLRALSVFVRQQAMARDGRRAIARLTGASWLDYLDRQLGDKGFTQGPGRVLASGPYQAQCDYDAEALFALLERWLEQQV